MARAATPKRNRAPPVRKPAAGLRHRRRSRTSDAPAVTPDAPVRPLELEELEALKEFTDENAVLAARGAELEEAIKDYESLLASLNRELQRLEHEINETRAAFM